MLYFAYGSNLNKRAMKRRCPAAVPVGKFFLKDARLVFRGVADCIGEPGATCPGAVWKITADCERALDRYEGFYADGNGMYRKEYLPISGYGDETELMLYCMNSTGIMPPSEGYLETIRDGYEDFGLPLEPLVAAVKRSWDDKHKTFAERARRHRGGYQTFARPSAASATIAAPAAKRATPKATQHANARAAAKASPAKKGPPGAGHSEAPAKNSRPSPYRFKGGKTGKACTGKSKSMSKGKVR